MSSYQPKRSHQKPKKSYICHDCGKVLKPKDAFSRVDGDNYSITQNAPIVCAECYVKRYGSTA